MLQTDAYWLPFWRFAIPALVALALSEGGNLHMTVSIILFSAS
jgi:hypothetical protein